MTSVPWTNVDTLYLEFSTDVSASLAAGDVLLTGTNGGDYSLGTITFVTPNVASIPIVDGIGNDSLVISIFPETVFDDTGASVVADDGSQFNFRFNVLPGDEDGSGQVNSTDAFSVFASNTFATTEAIARRDIDGSSQINSTDAFASFANNTNGLPLVPPTAPVPFAAASSPISLAAIDAAFSELSELIPVTSAAVQPVAALVHLDDPQTAVSSDSDRDSKILMSEFDRVESGPELALAGHVEAEELDSF